MIDVATVGSQTEIYIDAYPPSELRFSLLEEYMQVRASMERRYDAHTWNGIVGAKINTLAPLIRRRIHGTWGITQWEKNSFELLINHKKKMWRSAKNITRQKERHELQCSRSVTASVEWRMCFHFVHSVSYTECLPSLRYQGQTIMSAADRWWQFHFLSNWLYTEWTVNSATRGAAGQQREVTPEGYQEDDEW